MTLRFSKDYRSNLLQNFLIAFDFPLCSGIQRSHSHKNISLGSFLLKSIGIAGELQTKLAKQDEAERAREASGKTESWHAALLSKTVTLLDTSNHLEIEAKVKSSSQSLF